LRYAVTEFRLVQPHLRLNVQSWGGRTSSIISVEADEVSQLVLCKTPDGVIRVPFARFEHFVYGPTLSAKTPKP
jgi:hypothetical protein